jgi:PPOX class probable F420-dependent enzyme
MLGAVGVTSGGDGMAVDLGLTPEQVALLEKPALAHLATLMPDGSPQVSPVWIDTDGEAVLMNSLRGRLKVRNIERDPRIAVSLTDPDDALRPLLVRGTAELIDEGAREHIDRLSRKYLGVDYPYLRPGDRRVIIRLRPEHVTLGQG